MTRTPDTNDTPERSLIPGSPLFSHLNRALTPIKACATRKRLPAPTFTRTEA